MTYNIDEIRESLSFFNPEDFSEYNVHVFIDEFDKHGTFSDFSWQAGVTKCVIIPKDRDYVIKIPFNGMNDYGFVEFENGGGEGWDYCELEQEHWDEIIEGSGFEEFFLKVESVYANDNWPIYVQQKAEDIRFSSCSPKSVKTVREKSKIVGRVTLPINWLATCLENLNNDIKKLDEFVEFLTKNFHDLHSDNLGYYNGHAVVFDYAGFDD